MIGFYLTLNKNTKTGIELLSWSYDSLTELSSPRRQGLYIFEDQCRQMVAANGYTLFNIGTLIYKNAWREKALESIIYDLNDGEVIQRVMASTRGQFCLIVHTTDNVYIVTDKLGSFPVYIFENDKTIQISNILLLLPKNNDVSINHQALAEYLSFSYCFDCTFFNEIRSLKMATIYRFGTERKIQVYDDIFSDVHFDKYTNLREVAGIAKETLRHNLSFLSSDEKIFVDITGGFDSRTVATILRDMNISFETGICGEQILRESDLAKRVAESLGVKFHSDIKLRDINSFRQILEQHFKINTGVPTLYHSTELINYYEHIKQEFNIHITGFGGTELTKLTLPKLSFFSSKINKKSLIQKYDYTFKDIFVTAFLTKESYYDHLKRKIDNLLQTIGSDKHNEVANFLRLSTFTRFYAGSLIGTHNIIMPSYSPFLEGNYVRLMMETSYNLKDYHKIQRTILMELDSTVSSITTSHGYNSRIGSRWRIGKFRRSKDSVKSFSRRMIYQFGLFGTMKLLEDVMSKIKPTTTVEESQRLFWVDEVDGNWSDDMEVFDLIDRNKLNKLLVSGQEGPKLKAKILYLNRIINEFKPHL